MEIWIQLIRIQVIVEPIRVIVVDDNTALRQGVCRFLEKREEFQVIGDAPDGVEGIRLTIDLNPDILLLDLEMPHMNGLEVIRLLVKSKSPVKILILSAHNDRYHIQAALQAGAAGYIIKEMATSVMVSAIHRVLAGETGLVFA